LATWQEGYIQFGVAGLADSQGDLIVVPESGNVTIDHLAAHLETQRKSTGANDEEYRWVIRADISAPVVNIDDVVVSTSVVEVSGIEGSFNGGPDVSVDLTSDFGGGDGSWTLISDRVRPAAQRGSTMMRHYHSYISAGAWADLDVTAAGGEVKLVVAADNDDSSNQEIVDVTHDTDIQKKKGSKTEEQYRHAIRAVVEAELRNVLAVDTIEGGLYIVESVVGLLRGSLSSWTLPSAFYGDGLWQMVEQSIRPGGPPGSGSVIMEAIFQSATDWGDVSWN